MGLVLKKSFIFVFIFLILISSVIAADYYVATDGNNTIGNGTQLNPWLTIQYAITKSFFII